MGIEGFSVKKGEGVTGTADAFRLSKERAKVIITELEKETDSWTTGEILEWIIESDKKVEEKLFLILFLGYFGGGQVERKKMTSIFNHCGKSN